MTPQLRLRLFDEEGQLPVQRPANTDTPLFPESDGHLSSEGSNLARPRNRLAQLLRLDQNNAVVDVWSYRDTVNFNWFLHFFDEGTVQRRGRGRLVPRADKQHPRLDTSVHELLDDIPGHSRNTSTDSVAFRSTGAFLRSHVTASTQT
jgi:hypothetical protein